MSKDYFSDAVGHYERLEEEFNIRFADIAQQVEARREQLLAGRPAGDTGSNVHDALVAFYGADVLKRPSTVLAWENLASRFEGHDGEPLIVIERVPHKTSDGDYLETAVYDGVASEEPFTFTRDLISLSSARRAPWHKMVHKPSFVHDADGRLVETTNRDLKLAVRQPSWHSSEPVVADLVTRRLDQPVKRYDDGLYEVYLLPDDQKELPALEVCIGSAAIETAWEALDRIHFMRILPSAPRR